MFFNNRLHKNVDYHNSREPQRQVQIISLLSTTMYLTKFSLLHNLTCDWHVELKHLKMHESELSRTK